MMKNFLIASAIGTMLTAGVAVAMQTQTTAPQRAPMTKAQLLAAADARFDRLDTNKDGQLSAEERQAGREGARKAMAERRGKMGERILARIDTNGDGLISKAENRAAVEARFARIDANGNGTIDAGERPGRGMGKRGMRGPGGPGMGGGMMMADANKDGVVTRAEFDAMNAQRFARIDANKDGRIDAAEMQAQRAKMREGMKQMRERRAGKPGSPPAPEGE